MGSTKMAGSGTTATMVMLTKTSKPKLNETTNFLGPWRLMATTASGRLLAMT